MKINRAALRQAVTDALAAEKELHADLTTRWQAYCAEHREQWMAEAHPRWQDAIKTLNARIRRGEPITERDLPRARDYGGPVAVYQPPRQTRDRTLTDPGTYRPNPGLLALGTALDLIADDEVTVAGLKGVGITGTAIREALERLAKLDELRARREARGEAQEMWSWA